MVTLFDFFALVVVASDSPWWKMARTGTGPRALDARDGKSAEW